MHWQEISNRIEIVADELAGLVKHLNDISDPGVSHDIYIDPKGTIIWKDYYPPDVVCEYRREAR